MVTEGTPCGVKLDGRKEYTLNQILVEVENIPAETGRRGKGVFEEINYSQGTQLAGLYIDPFNTR